MATHDRVGGRAVHHGAAGRGRAADTRPCAVGDRVTVLGYHANYRPVIAEILDGMARLRTAEVPDGGQPHFVPLTRLVRL